MDRKEQIAEARRLGAAHGRAGIAPYGDLDDAGSADLMTALRETGPTTAGNFDWRAKLALDYMTSWQYGAGRPYMDPTTAEGVLTPRLFVLALAAEGLDATLEIRGGPGAWPVPMGYLPDGRGWILTDEADAGWAGPGAPMPGLLHLQVYESATENAARERTQEGLEFNEPVGILARISPVQASEAIRRAWSGDYGVFAGDTIGPAPLVEDLTYDADGLARAMFDERTRAYLRAVRLAGPATIAPWRTNHCPECGNEVSGGGLILAGAEAGSPHVLIRGSVVLGCEGYPIISPAALGLDHGPWDDWRGSRDAACINDNGPGLGYQVTLFGEYAGPVAAAYAGALAQLRAALAGLPQVAGIADPEIYYADHARGLIVKFPCPLADVRQDWDRPARLDDQLWWASLPYHIGVEALCLLCGQTFNPGGPDDLTHGVTQAGDPLTGTDEPCGGPGALLGAWR